MSRSVFACLRAFTVAALTTCSLVGASGPLKAQAIGRHDTNAPVNYAADRIELQERQSRAVLAGNVDVTQGDLRVRAAQVTVNYANAGSLQIKRMIAGGGVTVTRPGESARGDVAVYDFRQRIITMAGNVSLNRNGNTLNGARLVVNLDSGVSRVEGGGSGRTGQGGGRVSGTLNVSKRN